MQASNFGGTFDQLVLWSFYDIFTEDASPFFLYHGEKKVKNDQKLKSSEGGGGSCLNGIQTDPPVSAQYTARLRGVKWRGPRPGISRSWLKFADELCSDFRLKPGPA